MTSSLLQNTLSERPHSLGVAEGLVWENRNCLRCIEQISFELEGLDHFTCLQKFEGAYVGLLLAGWDSEAMASKALCLEQFVGILEQEWIIDRSCELDVANMPRTVVHSEAAGGTRRFVIER